ncbi:acyltransferase family protein [Vibrio sp. PNB22_3_1]
MMNFRNDINGLRAIAVIAVVLFHFNPSWVPGGFTGVDVFFVLSGFLMTGIIFRGLENNNFNLFKFYVARANRIIPALAVLCLVLLIFGWFYLTHVDYSSLGRHVVSSIVFLSNVTYWSESGYFDAASNEKWLLHTWSLSVEWQFYILYPIVLIALKRYISLENLKRLIIIGVVLGFVLSAAATMKWPNAAYYLLPTRAWEMMMGGIAFLYPWSLSSEKKKKLIEGIGLALILVSYFFVSSDVPWPGYFSLLPVFGTYLMVLANRQSSVVTNNFAFQCLGKWSYSIYLWHWPILVFGYYFDIGNWSLYGIILSLVFGFVSFKFIESYRFSGYLTWRDILKVKALAMVAGVSVLASMVVIEKGYVNRLPMEFKSLMAMANPSPYRDKCHIGEYQRPEDSCEYFENDVQWAILGDSHTVEIAYALAEKLKESGRGVKHFSFSGCFPSYGQGNGFSKCAKWYNESVKSILNESRIQNVVFNHRYSVALLGDHLSSYPNVGPLYDNFQEILESVDRAIMELSKSKKNIYVYLPIPEIKKPIGLLLSKVWLSNLGFHEVLGTTLTFYNKRNEVILNHFKNTSYPDNVIFIDPTDAFCDDKDCFAVRDGKALYFDDHHPSVDGARLLTDLISTH